MPGEFERMLGLAPELAPPDPRLQKIFDDMRGTGDQSMSDRKIPDPPQPQPTVRLGLQPDDTISVQITVGDKIISDVSMTYDQAAPFHDNFGKLLAKIRPQT
jgi:hypothetical protein